MASNGTSHIAEDRRTIVAGAKRAVLVRLGNRLKRTRARAGLTQSAIAQELGVTAQTVRNWEAGRHEPPPEAIKKLADRYEVSEEALLAGLDAAIIPGPRRGGPLFRYDRVNVDPGKLSEARKVAGFTQEGVARMTGHSASAIRRYESGSANPTTRTLETLATIYNRVAGWFTIRGYFTDEERMLFEASIALGIEKGAEGDLVISTYNRARQDLSNDAKIRIANFILFTHQLDLSGYRDDFRRISAATQSGPDQVP